VMTPDLVQALSAGPHVCAAELRPPRAELMGHEGMDAWIDTYHAVRRLTREGTYVFLTDSAVGAPEEDNIRHLVANLGPDAPRSRVVPFLTSKHPLAYCLSYADARGSSSSPRWWCSAGIARSAAALRGARMAAAVGDPVAPAGAVLLEDGRTPTPTRPGRRISWPRPSSPASSS